MKSIMQYGFTLLLILVVTVALYESREWNPTTALFPRAVGFPMLALLVSILVMNVITAKHRKEKGKKDDDLDKKFSTATRLSILYLGWLAGFILLAWAIGLPYSVPVYTFAYMKIQGKIGWLQCGIFAAGVTVFVFIFGYAFQMVWPEAALLAILR